MAVAAIATVKDEADIIGPVVEHIAGEVDFVIVADNGSTDGTRDLLADLADAHDLTVIDDPEVGYYQSRKMTRLARDAADHGAEWVVPFDADEWWYSPFGRIADVLSTLERGAVAAATLYDHVATALDPETPDPIEQLGWRRRRPGALPKVACRPVLHVTIEQGNHDANYDHDRIDGQLVVRHFPYRSVEQMVSKVRNGAAAYRASDLAEHQGAHWRSYGALLDAGGEDAIADVFRTWYWSPDPTADPDLIFDPAP